MATKKQVSLAGMKVGIFVLVAFILLSILMLQQSWGLNWFTKSIKAVTYLPDVGGLKPGAPVWLAGIEIGRVRKVAIVPPEAWPGNAALYQKIQKVKEQIETLEKSETRSEAELVDLREEIRKLKQQIRVVEVQLEIRPQYLHRISKDSEVSIESRGLIGDSFLDISPGTYGVLPEKKGEYYLIEGIQQPGFREIMTGANDVVANFGVITERFKDMAAKIQPGKIGSNVAETIQEVQKTFRYAGDTFSRASSLIGDLHTGKGSFGRIVSDPELYQRLNESLERFNSIFENLQNGKGTLGKLLNDPGLYDSAHTTLQKANEVMERIEKGEGTLGRLSKDAELYERTRIALERFASLVEEIEQGKGTMGKLLKNPSLYNNLDQSTAEISKFLYDLRKDPKKYLTIRFRLF